MSRDSAGDVFGEFTRYALLLQAQLIGIFVLN